LQNIIAAPTTKAKFLGGGSKQGPQGGCAICRRSNNHGNRLQAEALVYWISWKTRANSGIRAKGTQLGCNGLSRSHEHRATHLNGIIREKVVEVRGRTRSTEEITRRAARKSWKLISMELRACPPVLWRLLDRQMAD